MVNLNKGVSSILTITFFFRKINNEYYRKKERKIKMFENTLVNDIHKSRYFASWIRSGGAFDRKGRHLFQKWLATLIINGRHLTHDEIMQIFNYAENGKLELELNAERFLKEEAKQ